MVIILNNIPNVSDQISDYILSLPVPKSADIQELNEFIVNLLPGAKLWFLNGKNYLPSSYSDKIGRAIVTGYCIKFKNLKDINVDVLEQAIKDGAEQTSTI